ncbi:MAG TPA: hypothetical protein VGF73_05230 [Chthoniobacterales bacterium]
MSWMNEVAHVLQNYTETNQPPAGEDVAAHYNQVAQAAPPADLAGGLAAMFHSNQTPPFAQMIGQLFSNSNGAQRANLLNSLLSGGAASGILSQLTQTADISLPAGLGSSAPVTPEAAAQIPPAVVEQAAAQAQQHDPSIVERAGEFYAQHPTLVKTLGTAAMAIALSHLARQRR